MKKLRYVSPVIEYIELKEADIIATSGFGGGNGHGNGHGGGGKPGHGWGDNNHDHFGPPGHKKDW